MITSKKEIHGSIDYQNIRQDILAIGIDEVNVWKRVVLSDEKLFEYLFQLVFSHDLRVAWRSCWIIDHASKDHPELLANKLPEMINGLLTMTNVSLKRQFTRILCRYQIPEIYLGVLINRCFELLAPSEAIAVRANAMQLLFNISRDIPDLKGELTLVIENLIEEGGSAGFLNRSHRLLHQLRS